MDEGERGVKVLAKRLKLCSSASSPQSSLIWRGWETHQRLPYGARQQLRVQRIINSVAPPHPRALFPSTRVVMPRARSASAEVSSYALSRLLWSRSLYFSSSSSRERRRRRASLLGIRIGTLSSGGFASATCRVDARVDALDFGAPAAHASY